MAPVTRSRSAARVVRGLEVALALAGATAVGLVLLVVLSLREPSVPSRDELPDLPSELVVSSEREGCGSGSCYRELFLSGTGESAGWSREQVVDALDLPPDLSGDCRANSLLDRRPLCVGVADRDDAVVVYVSLGEWLA